MFILTYDAKVIVAIGHHATYLCFSVLLWYASGHIVFNFSFSRPEIALCLRRQRHELFLFTLIKLNFEITTDCEQSVPLLLDREYLGLHLSNFCLQFRVITL